MCLGHLRLVREMWQRPFIDGCLSVKYRGRRPTHMLRWPSPMLTGADALCRTHQATRPGDKLLLEDKGCGRCSREIGGMGAAAVELVRMVDVRKARGVPLTLLVFICGRRGWVYLPALWKNLLDLLFWRLLCPSV